MLPQDRIFSEYQQAFHKLPHPSGTEFIASYAAFGVLDKVRVMYAEDFPQGCDYRVGEVREYFGAPENVEAFYTSKSVEVRGQSLSPGVLFVPVDEAGRFDPYGLSRDELVTQGPTAFALLESLREDSDLLNLNPSGSYYYVGIGGFSLSDYDIRCKF
jgi:hypothetical protein